MRITIEIHESEFALLEVIARAEGETVEGIVEQLVDHAQQGVYRPGAWERNWLISAFGPAFLKGLEPDPVLVGFDRPVQS